MTKCVLGTVIKSLHLCRAVNHMIAFQAFTKQGWKHECFQLDHLHHQDQFDHTVYKNILHLCTTFLPFGEIPENKTIIWVAPRRMQENFLKQKGLPSLSPPFLVFFFSTSLSKSISLTRLVSLAKSQQSRQTLEPRLSVSLAPRHSSCSQHANGPWLSRTSVAHEPPATVRDAPCTEYQHCRHRDGLTG